jgi:hypothetical protein
MAAIPGTSALDSPASLCILAAVSPKIEEKWRHWGDFSRIRGSSYFPGRAESSRWTSGERRSSQRASGCAARNQVDFSRPARTEPLSAAAMANARRAAGDLREADEIFGYARMIAERERVTDSGALAELDDLEASLRKDQRRFDRAEFLLLRALVRELAEQMVPIFAAQDVHREALAALRLFVEAARADAAQLDLVADLRRYLRDAQADREHRFR